MNTFKVLSLWILTLADLGSSLRAGPLAIVSHLTRVKIVDSNMVSVRPGSVYENRTYFESLFDFPNPGFNYRFVDTGLGTAEPLYPLYQKGHQGSWWQLIFAFFGEGFSRHIDHFTSLPTIEGCHVDSVYMLRNISEFPSNLYSKERAEGFKQIVIRLEYYTRLQPDAQCGRHKSNPPDSNFNPMKFLKRHLWVKSLSDFPQAELSRFEAHIAAIRHIKEEFGRDKWPRFDMEDLRQNSLWYYPQGFEEDYGIDQTFSLPELPNLKRAKHLVHPATDFMRSQFTMNEMINEQDWETLKDFMNGKPTEDYSSQDEPGHDVLQMNQISNRNVYTSGLSIIPIKNPQSILTDRSKFKLVGLSLQPFLEQEDAILPHGSIVPQIRLVFQHYEQLYFHLNFDVIDRAASAEQRQAQHLYFLSRIDSLADAQESQDDLYESMLADFVLEFTYTRPVQELSFSSSLTGPWIFGQLSRSYNLERELLPVWIKRNGVDIGYYSSVNDNDLFRSALLESEGEHRESLQAQLDSLWVEQYRDTKRTNAHEINFQRMTCAQCHHASGRDAVHMSLNDHLDRRIPYPMRATEFVYREAERQLEEVENRWLELFPSQNADGEIQEALD